MAGKKPRNVRRMVVNRGELAGLTRAELEMSDATKIKSGIEDHFSKGLENRQVEVPEPGPWLQFADKMLEYYTEDMTEKDAANVAEMINDIRLRSERDRLTDEIVDDLRSLSGLLESLFGPDFLAELALADKLADRPAAVLRQLDLVTNQLDTVSAPPDPRWPVAGFDTQSASAQLKAKGQSLRDFLKGLEKESRKAEATVVDKQEAITEWDDRFLRIARFVESLYGLAALDEKARRFRPKVRQVGRPVRPEEETGVATEVADTAEPPGVVPAPTSAET